MKRYLEQLINDMRESARNVSDEDLTVFFRNADDEDNLPFSEDYQHGPRRKLSEIVGIPSMSFPPEDQLTDNQTEILAREMELLLKAYFFYPEFPSGVPGRLRYRHLIRIWDDEHVFLINGENHLEFCDYDETNCPFPGYCNICSQINKFKDKENEEDEEDEEFTNMKYDPLTDSDEMDDIEDNEIVELFNPGQTGRFIPSIYNYCDGWCERCPFKKRCFYYHHEIGNIKHHELTKEEFLDSMRCILEKTRYFINKEIGKRGIELKNLDDDSYKQIQEEIKEHPLVKDGQKYSLIVSQWIYDNRDYIKQKMDRRNIKQSEQQLFNDVQVIHWDHTMIPAKISRAIHGLIDKEDSFAVEDANGSAKVALILVERSLEAWENLQAAFHEKEVEIFGITNQLSKLRNEILEDFPNAPEFHRPGFDD